MPRKRIKFKPELLFHLRGDGPTKEAGTLDSKVQNKNKLSEESLLSQLECGDEGSRHSFVKYNSDESCGNRSNNQEIILGDNSNTSPYLSSSRKYKDDLSRKDPSEEKEERSTPKKPQMLFFTYSSGEMINYELNYDKRIKELKKQACIMRSTYNEKDDEGEMRRETSNIYLDTIDRLRRFHMALSYYYGIEED